jgi:anti-sigma regulatory factor (Ser/Thr protein kinase)
MHDIIRFHVPCKLEYTKLVEDVTNLIGFHLHLKDRDQFSSKLRAVMNEVFINIVEHSNTAAQNEIVRFQFEIGFQYFVISIFDYGPGFPADGCYPPYPKEICGKRFKLRDVIDGTVFFTVIDPFTVSFSFDERAEALIDQLGELNNLKDHGLGISIVTKLMDTVTYSYVGQGKYDWKLIKKLEN